MDTRTAEDIAAQASAIEPCFHCGLPVPPGLDIGVQIDGSRRSMCCHGCEAVAEAIVAAGHENFYRVRTEASPTGQDLVPDFLRETQIYDAPEIQRQFVHALEDNLREASLILEGITCAACVWLNEQYLAGLPGVSQVRVNYATQRAWVQWDDARIKLSEILQAVRQIGYRAIPFNPDQQQEIFRCDRRRQQRRLAIAGLFGMQVMMLSISLYAGAFSGMERGFEQFFRWLCLGLSLPVIGYSAIPFFVSAWRDIRRRRVGMDVPVTLAIAIAFAASLRATLLGDGEIYFDSVVMFVFFLSASRYFESMARQRCAASVEQLAQAMPMMATRIEADGSGESTVSAASLSAGDRVLLRPGETVPADGVLLTGSSALDESLISGESLPQPRKIGDRLLGGSVNVTNPLQMEVTATGADTVMAEIQRTIERAQADKPPLAQLADRVAAHFIAIVLLIVASVAVYWFMQAPERWFEIALSVLIVSCPCALSLATPTALSAVLGRLQTVGLLVKQGGALEKLNRVTHVVFDKTGTLTLGQPVLKEIVSAAGIDSDTCLGVAASIERHSEHPLARALQQAAGDISVRDAVEIVNTAGGGISARIDGRSYYLGSNAFIEQQAGADIPREWLLRVDQDAATAVFLADDRRVMAMFSFSDRLRDDAARLTRHLAGLGKTLLLMTGDREASARQIAAQVEIDDYRAAMSPTEKMSAVEDLQRSGARVLMIGDGINDAPVLARADVSIAMGGASALAKTSADIVLMTDQLDSISVAIEKAAQTQRIIRQNMTWALMYNFGAIPAAAVGLIAPWLAALGMSLSSLLVVVNALRLTRQ